MIDTHAHLDGGTNEAAALVRRAREAGVTRIVAVGSGIESSHATLRLAREHDGVYAALGIHPHQAGDDAPLDELRTLLDRLEHVDALPPDTPEPIAATLVGSST